MFNERRVGLAVISLFSGERGGGAEKEGKREEGGTVKEKKGDVRVRE